MTQTYTTEEEEKRKEWFLENWPFETKQTPNELWSSRYRCFHCEAEGEVKNYRTQEDIGSTFIMCEYEHCSGSALDMKVIDPVEVESTKLWKEKGMPEGESDEEWDKNYEEAKARLQI